jgi:hypothetical protein
MYSCSSRDSVTIREGRDSWMRMLSMVDGCWRPNGKSPLFRASGNWFQPPISRTLRIQHPSRLEDALLAIVLS